ncbi:hypothetical protein [Paenibacillus sp. TCA20]|uniref:hypothetical protein n=1 Tax=Paenibacillus sp. TCA20 TaxID=1499968 RepID=UPI0012680607|nr:hypothetical protein [Paenibacillus sp. TCA20]
MPRREVFGCRTTFAAGNRRDTAKTPNPHKPSPSSPRKSSLCRVGFGCRTTFAGGNRRDTAKTPLAHTRLP